MKKYTYHADGDANGGRIEQNGFGIIANTEGEHDDMRRLVDQANAAAAMLPALVESRNMLWLARQYFPSAVRNADCFSLLNLLANTVDPAIAKARGEG